MENRKPNTLLTVALVLMVLAAVICLIVFLGTRASSKDPAKDDTQISASTEPASDVPEGSETTPDESDPVPAAPSYDAEALQADLNDCVDGLDSAWQVVVIDLADGTSYEAQVNCKQTDTMVAADLTKLFLMAAAYDRVAAGELTEDQITDLVTRMIRDDDATAANELTVLLGGGDGEKGRAVVNAYALSIGCSHTEFNRLFGESGTQNYTTAGDCAILLQLIAEGNCVSPEASATMREILTGTDGERIPGGLPEGVTCAHLNGNITGTCCADAGIVFAENRSFVLVIICNNPITNEGSTKKCVQLTEIVYGYLG